MKAASKSTERFGQIPGFKTILCTLASSSCVATVQEKIYPANTGRVVECAGLSSLATNVHLLSPALRANSSRSINVTINVTCWNN